MPNDLQTVLRSLAGFKVVCIERRHGYGQADGNTLRKDRVHCGLIEPPSANEFISVSVTTSERFGGYLGAVRGPSEPVSGNHQVEAG